jgi:hypothetical protein
MMEFTMVKPIIRDTNWCYECQCFHENPDNKKCKEEAIKRGEHKTGMIRDMLDYN